MAVVVSIEDVRPSPRFDGLPWTQVQIWEAATEDAAFPGSWTLLETINLSTLPGGVDADPRVPAYRSVTTQLGTAAEQWYTLVFLDATADSGLPTVPIQNVADDRPVYAAVSELAQVLKVSATTRHDDLMRVLKAAADEIDHEIGTADINSTSLPYSNPPSIVRQVNLDRALEHWQDPKFGIVTGMGFEGAATFTMKNPWERHAHKLAILKADWGLA